MISVKNYRAGLQMLRLYRISNLGCARVSLDYGHAKRNDSPMRG